VDTRTYTQKYEQAFLEDSRILSLEKPEILARATDHIAEMADFIAELERKGYAYRTDDGSYYFHIAKFPEYGKLSKKDFAGMEVGARVDVDEYEKDDARDFALWKAPKPGEAQWQTNIGPGRPGWHIECSVMAMKYLGESFDIHLGGEDLIFPHHENEIAQSESLTGKTFARFWVHVRFLLVNGQKMSKSLGNFYTLRDLIVLGHKPSSIRYLLASVPYRRQLNFILKDGLEQAANSVRNLRDFKWRLETTNFPETGSPEFANVAKEGLDKMRAALADDLNTAEALAAIFEMIGQANIAANAGKLGKPEVAQLLRTLEEFDSIFDVIRDNDAEKIREIAKWAESQGKDVQLAVSVNHFSDTQIEGLIAERNAARKRRDFARADAIRKQLAEAGVILEDTKDGVRWKRA
jgi:cysteinyl-tRNA synthetase